MKFLSIVILAGISLGNVNAQNIPSAQEITRNIVKATTAYADSIACEHSKIEAKNIAALTPYKTMDSRGDAKYAVLWSGDIGCAGGSGTSGSAITIVKIGAGDSVLVDPVQSSPNISHELPVRYVERLVGNTADSLIIEGKEYGKDDPNCCPSVHVRATLKVDVKGNWKMIEKKVIPGKR